jgi:phage gpG-like protein
MNMTKTFASIAEFVAFTAGLEESMRTANRAILEAACQAVEAEAKRVIGTYAYGWEQLAPATQAERVRLGFPANEPLLRTGELRESIQHTIIDDHHAEVGSDSDIAVYQELGTARIPPRSFLMQAAVHEEKLIRKIAKEIWVAALLPHSIEAAIARIVYDALKDLAHGIKESVEDLTDPNTENPHYLREVRHGVEHAIRHVVRHAMRAAKE